MPLVFTNGVKGLPLNPRSEISDLFLLVHTGQAPIDFRDRLSDLILARCMRRGFCLALQFDLGKAERFHLPHVLGVDLRSAILRDLARFLEFVHALLQARFSVDQSFSSVTHESAHYSAVIKGVLKVDFVIE